MDLSRFTRGVGFRQTMLLTAGCFVLIALGVTGVTIVSRKYSRQGTRQTETLTGQFLPGLVTLARLRVATFNLKSITYQFALAKDEAAMKEQEQAFQDSSARVTRSIAELKLLAHDEMTQRLITAFAAGVKSYREGAEKFQTELGAGEFEKAMATLDHQVGPAQQRTESQLQAIAEHYFQLTHEASTRTTALLGQSDRFGLLATIVLAGFTLVCLALTLGATRALLVQVQNRDAERQAAQDGLEKRVEERTRELTEEIAERKRTAEALQQRQTELRVLFDLMPAMIWFKDTKNGFLRVNQRVAEATGLAVEEIEGKSAYEIFPQQAVGYYADDLQVIQSGLPKMGIVEKLAGPKGQELWILTDKVPFLDEHGKVIGLVAMVQDITERKSAEAELENVHKQLLEISRQAGMAEVATGVLHNVGNVLNSVNVSATLVMESVQKSKSANVPKLAALLDEHGADLAAFVSGDPRGRQLPSYVRQLGERLQQEQQGVIEELKSLVKNIDHIKDIVSMQQSYGKVSGVTEVLMVTDLVEDSLHLNAAALVRHQVEIVRDFQAVPPINIEKHKVLQILVNLIRNAKYACDEAGRTEKRVTLRVANGHGCIRIAVSDNGVGIPPENLTRIFNHGFTTRKEGHGFGLHSGALAAQQLGGSLTVQSDGPGRGATFTLELPVGAAA